MSSWDTDSLQGQALLKQAQACFDACEKSAPALLEELRSAGLLGQVWRLALLAQDLVVPNSEMDLSCLDGIPQNASVEIRSAACRAYEALALRSVLHFSPGQLESIRHAHARLCQGLNERRAEIRRHVMNGWQCYLEGHIMADAKLLDACLKEARELGHAALTVEIECVRALLQLANGDIEEAVLLVRRASRMAKVEGIPAVEVLANIALARARRFQNAPHLSLRILTALLRIAPSVWHPWIHWELRMAGYFKVIANEATWAASLSTFLHRVAKGSADVSEAAEAMLSCVSVAPFRFDVEGAIELMLYPEDALSMSRLSAWREGGTPSLPAGLSGLAFASEDSQHSVVTAFVRVQLNGQGHRLPSLAYARFAPVESKPGAKQSQPRTDAGLSLLALSKGSQSKRAYFAALYRFDYESGVHDAMFAMHLSRMRTRLGKRGDVVTEGDQIVLVPHEPLMLRDPRSEEQLPQRTLRVLSARRGGYNAKELAKTLGVPLRNVQRVLKELASDGALRSVSKGRSVVYEVEDTTFSENTENLTLT